MGKTAAPLSKGGKFQVMAGCGAPGGLAQSGLKMEEPLQMSQRYIDSWPSLCVTFKYWRARAQVANETLKDQLSQNGPLYRAGQMIGSTGTSSNFRSTRSLQRHPKWKRSVSTPRAR